MKDVDEQEREGPALTLQVCAATHDMISLVDLLFSKSVLNYGRYWIAVKNGRIDFGVGDNCGQHTVLSYQDPEYPIEVCRRVSTCVFIKPCNPVLSYRYFNAPHWSCVCAVRDARKPEGKGLLYAGVLLMVVEEL